MSICHISPHFVPLQRSVFSWDWKPLFFHWRYLKYIISSEITKKEKKRNENSYKKKKECKSWWHVAIDNVFYQHKSIKESRLYYLLSYLILFFYFRKRKHKYGRWKLQVYVCHKQPIPRTHGCCLRKPDVQQMFCFKYSDISINQLNHCIVLLSKQTWFLFILHQYIKMAR